ncbi:dTDP-4-dehydrorhamnose 3,5-epimerase family protein [Aeromonas media]|uniref:dTDP-4-dehydrorhamnose 3,5-epimerase family protein n=1 Tax=Aeromonas media TaxID=651 RepID=UPI001CF51552
MSGFVHCFNVLSEMAVVLYKCTDHYSPEFEPTINWTEPVLVIPGSLMENSPLVLLDKDRCPLLPL